MASDFLRFAKRLFWTFAGFAFGLSSGAACRRLDCSCGPVERQASRAPDGEAVKRRSLSSNGVEATGGFLGVGGATFRAPIASCSACAVLFLKKIEAYQSEIASQKST